MYSKRFQYLHDKTMYTRCLLRCGRRLDCYRGMEGSLEGLNLLNVCNCGWQFVPFLYGPREKRHLVHCNVGVWGEEYLCPPPPPPPPPPTVFCCRLTARWILTPGSQPNCALSCRAWLDGASSGGLEVIPSLVS